MQYSECWTKYCRFLLIKCSIESSEASEEEIYQAHSEIKNSARIHISSQSVRVLTHVYEAAVFHSLAGEHEDTHTSEHKRYWRQTVRLLPLAMINVTHAVLCTNPHTDFNSDPGRWGCFNFRYDATIFFHTDLILRN